MPRLAYRKTSNHPFSRDKGTFEWSDGSVRDYERWLPGEPNGRESGEDCVHIFVDGRWNDIGCRNAHTFVCRRSVRPFQNWRGRSAIE